jgi:thioredoxin reductase
MTTILEPARETPVIHDTEVLVVGSGPGGLAAAIAVARGVALEAVDVAAMQDVLRGQGVRVQ